MSTDTVKNNREIEMKSNQAYETVTLPSSPRFAAHIHTEPCPAYEVVIQAHHWGTHFILLLATVTVYYISGTEDVYVIT